MSARVAILVLLALVIGASPSRAGDEPDLDQLRSQILEARKKVGGHEAQERALLVQLEESDRLSEALTHEVAKVREEAREARERADLFLRKSREAQKSLEATRRAMARRVVALYKAGEVGPVRFLFASDTVPEMLQRASALHTFVAYDARLVEQYRIELVAFQELEGQATAAAKVRDEKAASLAERSDQLQQERRARRELLARVRQDRTQERAMLVELEKAARALEDTLTALGDAARTPGQSMEGHDFAARRGHLAPPLDARIALPFGRVVDDVFHTETFRKGVEFEAAGGESVRAVAPGIVRFAGWFRGYGKLVIVDQGDDYFTVVSHLEDTFVDVGDRVAEGDTLGSVGDTGSLTGPSLYFEIRHGSEPLDPAAWLAPRGLAGGGS